MPQSGFVRTGEETRVDLQLKAHLPWNHFAQLHLRSSVAEQYPDLKILGGLIGDNKESIRSSLIFIYFCLPFRWRL